MNLPSKQNVKVLLSGQDGAGNAAPVTVDTLVIDNHAVAYAVQQNANQVIVVSRGPVGNCRLTINAKSAGGATLTQTLDFTVLAGDASQLVLTPSAPANWDLTVPDMPAGW